MSRDLRGRPRGQPSIDYGNLESIVLIASKYDVDPKHLLNAICFAVENARSQCGGLTISCREMKNGFATFLITMGEKVVWQFPVRLKGIQSQDARDHLTKMLIPREKVDLSQKDLTIAELRVGMKGINVKGTIVEIPPTRRVYTRWGREAYVSNVKLADETEAIRIGLWNGQIDTVHVGDEVELENCSVKRFAGKLQLQLGRKSTISVIDSVQQNEINQASTSKIEA